MNRELSRISKTHVRSLPAALKALALMELQVNAASTYDAIRKIANAAEAIKLLNRDVDVIREQAEDVILIAHARIGEEINRTPKASGRPAKNKPQQGKIKSGRGDIGIPHSTRARYQKLAAAKPKLKAIAKRLREQGKEATVTAVVREITQGDKKQARANRESVLGQKQRALPDAKFGVILADPEWRFEPWSRESGMDRAAENHYPTSDTDVIAARDVPSIAADDCVLFLWATVPMLPHALAVMGAWGFEYRSHFIWAKDRVGKGYWNRNRHELLLVGARGKIPAPAPGTQWDSLINGVVGEHSVKPDVFFELIESYFPTLPKIELNRRGPPRSGWSAWGNEAEDAA